MMTLPQDWRVYAVVLGGAIGIYLFAKREVVDAVQSAAAAVNPLDQDNVFYTGVNAVGAKVTGGEFSLGAAIYEWWNPDRVAAERAAIGATAGAPR